MSPRFAFLVLAAALALTAGPSRTAGSATCEAPESALDTAGELPAVAAAHRAGGPLRVTVVGSASTGGAGTSGPGKSYTAKLAAALSHRLKIEVGVEAHGRRGWTARGMAEEMPDIVAADQPHLVIWQTGTVDAVREVAPEAFGQALAKGAEALKQGGVDLLLMDMQYSAIGARLIDFGPYLEHMNWTAAAFGSPIFHRHAVMRAWAEENRFGDPGRRKADQESYADQVHACIAELLAQVITEVQADSGPR